MGTAINTKCFACSIKLIALVFAVVYCGVAVAEQAASFLPLTYNGPSESDISSLPATTKVRSTAVRSNPADNARLIGYLPGATRISVYPKREKNGWMPVAPMGGMKSWSRQGKGYAWVKRSDLAMQEDYRPFDGVWPLLYMEFAAGDIDFVWVFPPDNHCTKEIIAQVIPKVAKATDVDRADVACQELWMVSHTNLVYANPNNEETDLWYDRRKGLIYPSTIIGTLEGSLIYGYRNGSAKVVDIRNAPSNSNRTIATSIQLLADMPLSKKPKMYDPMVRFYKVHK